MPTFSGSALILESPHPKRPTRGIRRVDTMRLSWQP
jgi:hypothetical protein